MTNLKHSSFFYMFISILYMFRATSCSSSGESIVLIQHWYVSLWPSSMQVGKEFFPDLHTRRSPTQSDTYQMLYWYNWFSWWWARGCSKRVEIWNIQKENCASSWSFTRINYKVPLNVSQYIVFPLFKRRWNPIWCKCVKVYVVYKYKLN
jgi:hypothetical protein